MASEAAKEKLKVLSDKFLHNNSLIFTYLRSIVSSQVAGWADMLIGIVLFSLAGIPAFWSTAIGALCGGIINCIINYRFTFNVPDVDWRAVIVKYALVWLGSLMLNSYGTTAIHNLLMSWEWLRDLGFTNDGCYAAARLFVSLMVSWFWNFALQRYFVYRSLWCDLYIIKGMTAIGIGKKQKNNVNNEN